MTDTPPTAALIARLEALAEKHEKQGASVIRWGQPVKIVFVKPFFCVRSPRPYFFQYIGDPHGYILKLQS